MTEQLKTMLNNLINEKHEEATLDFHSYLTDRIKKLTESAKSIASIKTKKGQVEFQRGPGGARDENYAVKLNGEIVGGIRRNKDGSWTAEIDATGSTWDMDTREEVIHSIASELAGEE